MKIVVKKNGIKLTEKLINSTSVIVGRSLSCDVTVVDEGLSRQHCRVEIQDGDFFITDLDSSNGVTIDGIMVIPQTKNSFKIFNHIKIGILDLEVTDPDTVVTDVHNLELDLTTSRHPNTKLKRNEAIRASTIPSTRRSTEKSKNNFGLIISIGFFIFIIAALFHQISGDKKELSNLEAMTPTAPTRIIQKRVPNEFYLNSEYEEMLSKASCTSEAEKCEELELKEDQGEGIYSNGRSVLIFARPTKIEGNVWPEKIKENPDFETMVLLFKLFNSSLITRYKNRDLEEIQIILLNSERKAVKVFRLHQENFSIEKHPLEQISQSLQEMIENNNLSELWKSTGGPFPFKDIAK